MPHTAGCACIYETQRQKLKLVHRLPSSSLQTSAQGIQRAKLISQQGLLCMVHLRQPGPVDAYCGHDPFAETVYDLMSMLLCTCSQR